MQPAAIAALDGQQDLLVLIAHDETIGLHGHLFLRVECWRFVEQGQGDAVVWLPLLQALTLLVGIRPARPLRRAYT